MLIGIVVGTLVWGRGRWKSGGAGPGGWKKSRGSSGGGGGFFHLGDGKDGGLGFLNGGGGGAYGKAD